MPRSNNRGGRNNNPTGRNQYSDWGLMEMARERPITAAAVAAGTAAAGLFLWSKRAQISDQLTNLSDQISEWKSETGSEFDDTAGLTSMSQTRSSRGMSETGGGNASLGRKSGGGGTTGSASGRGRARSNATT